MSRAWYRSFAAAAFVLALAGCASQPVKLGEPPATTITSADAARAAPAALAISIDGVIIPNGPGHWMPDAPWNEFHLTLRNGGDAAIVVDAIELVGELASAPATAAGRDVGTGAGAQAVAGAAALAGTSAAVAVAPAMVAGGATAIGLGAGSYYTTLGAVGLAAGLVVIPVAVAGGIAMIVASNRHAARREKLAKLVDEHFAQAFKAPLEVGAKQAVATTVYFPTVRGSRFLAARFQSGGQALIAVVDLAQAQLEGMTVARRIEPPPRALVHRFEPYFPKSAFQADVDKGFVRARLTVDAAGNVRLIEIVESSPPGTFDAAARRAFSRYHYAPGPAETLEEQLIEFDRAKR